MKGRSTSSSDGNISGSGAAREAGTEEDIRLTDSSSYGTFQPPGRAGNRQQTSVSSPEHEPGDTPPQHTYALVYCSHFLSAWGDRMWSFGVGLFLVAIAGNNLQLPATYGLASGLAIFVLGAPLGDWVDSTPRLKAAQLSLVVQNVLVAVCAGGVYAYIQFEEVIVAVEGGWAVPMCHAGIILLAVLADMASIARVIAVERDWIVKICGSDNDMLAKMTATLRRIDQTTLIVAPAATGQVMTYAGLKNGALFIGVWNLLSVALEYYLMWKVYTTVPALATKNSDEEPGKKINKRTQSSIAKADQETSPATTSPSPSSQPIADSGSMVVTTTPLLNEFSKSHKSDIVSTVVADTEILLDDSDDLDADVRRTCCGEGCCSRQMEKFSVLYEGWRTYMKYSVGLAGLALAFLFMTVLGFDNITVAYAVTQGVSESILGILMGVSAIFGMLGTFIYPIMRRRVGLVRTGILALSMQAVCLSLCVVSVWMPGSPFDPFYKNSPTDVLHNTTLMPTTQAQTTEWLSQKLLADGASQTAFTDFDRKETIAGIASFETLASSGSTVVWTSDFTTNSSTEPQPSGSDRVSNSYLSVVLLMTGIVSARFGLWIADLAITQQFLEMVVERERGVVNGVQNSLNKLMDVLKFLLVVFVPDTETFGFLIIISFLFVCIGWLLYAIFLRRVRGHFFHTCVRSNIDYVRHSHGGETWYVDMS